MSGQGWRDRVAAGRMRRVRGVGSLGAVAIAVVWGLVSVPASASVAAVSASLPTGCAQASVGGTVTCTYNYTGGVQAFSVPSGVSSVTITAYGGHGATAGQGSPAVGGSGGLVTGTFPVTPNDVLDVTVGGDSGNFQGAFGYGNGGASDFSSIGAGGGGGSAVVTSENLVLVVAGGGGGGGIRSNCTTGGNGGDGGQNGNNGGKCGSTPGGTGGTSGGSTSTNGTTGPLGFAGGGGGGGGGFAGGSGGTGISFDSGAEGYTGAGGGGGGTNHADASGTGISTSGVSSRGEGANGLVTIAYQPTGTVSSLGLSPSNPAPIVPDQPQSFTATTFNAAGASVADVTAQTTFSIAPDGTCAGSQCTATLAGPHTVTGTFNSGAGTLTATATLDVTAGPAGVVTASAGDDQSADAGQAFGTDLGATVTDLFTNPLANTPVTFTVTSGSATFPGGLSTTTEMTNSQGVATAPTLTAGMGGPVTVTAAVTGVATPATYNLTVDQAPAITLQPANQIVGSGTTATFSAAATGFPSPTVQWQVSTNGGSSFSDITGATSDTYSFTATQANNGDDYRAVFSNGIASDATTHAATLTVRTRPDILTGGSATAMEHQPFSFTVRSVGSPTPTLTESGRLPAGIRVVTGTDGTATIEGTAGPEHVGHVPAHVDRHQRGRHRRRALHPRRHAAAGPWLVRRGRGKWHVFQLPIWSALHIAGFQPRSPDRGPGPK